MDNFDSNFLRIIPGTPVRQLQPLAGPDILSLPRCVRQSIPLFLHRSTGYIARHLGYRLGSPVQNIWLTFWINYHPTIHAKTKAGQSQINNTNEWQHNWQWFVIVVMFEPTTISFESEIEIVERHTQCLSWHPPHFFSVTCNINRAASVGAFFEILLVLI